jgi:hypothetical protein
LVVAVAILGGVVLASLGRAGEMADFASDTAPIELDDMSATDVALLRPPMSLWGYNAPATEDALQAIARSVTARDVEIATLRRELADLRGDTGATRATATGDWPVGLPGWPGPPRPAGHAGQAHRAGPAGQAAPLAGEAGRAGRPDAVARPGPPEPGVDD